MSLSGKTIALTGAASGLGLAASRLLASKGAKISIADVQEKALSDLAAELEKSGVEFLSTVLDVRDRPAVEAWAKATTEKFGKLDGLVNLAGVAGKGILKHDIDEIEDEDWDWVFDVNVKGTLNVLRANIPDLNNGASVVLIASLAGLFAHPKNAAYIASKHAVVGLARCATTELGPRNIRVNCVCPGPISTPLWHATSGPGSEMIVKNAPLQRLGEPGEEPRKSLMEDSVINRALRRRYLFTYLLGVDRSLSSLSPPLSSS